MEVIVQHTPAPWVWFTRQEDAARSSPRDMSIKYLNGANGQGFAHTVGLGEPEDTANARLIAAAPDLLAALKMTLNYWTDTGFAECEPDCDCIVEAVKAAIAKAEGR